MTREETIEILRAKAVDIPIGWETSQWAQGVKVKTIIRGTLWRAIRRWGDTQKKKRITRTDMEKGQNNERNKRMGRNHN